MKTKFAIGCLVQWYECDIIGEYVESLKDAIENYDGEVIVDLDESEYYGVAPDMGAYEYNTLSIDRPVEMLPNKYSLEYPCPNPFNPTTSIVYSLPIKSKVIIEIYNINGELINTLQNGIKTAGNHNIEWNAEGYPSGVYFVKLSSEEFTQTQKLMLIK